MKPGWIYMFTLREHPGRVYEGLYCGRLHGLDHWRTLPWSSLDICPRWAEPSYGTLCVPIVKLTSGMTESQYEDFIAAASR